MGERDLSESPEQHQDIPAQLGVFPLRNSVVYPFMPQQLTASRPQSIAVIEAAEADDNLVGIFAQKNPEDEEPVPEGMYGVGAIAKIHKVWRLPDGSVRLIVQGGKTSDDGQNRAGQTPYEGGTRTARRSW